MSKQRDDALFRAVDALLFAFQKVNEARIVCKDEALFSDASELENALDHTQQAIDWVKITRGNKAEVASEGVTEDDILEEICDADMFEGNARAIAQSVYAMLQSQGVVK